MKEPIISWRMIILLFLIYIEIVSSNNICYRLKHFNPICKTDNGKLIRYKASYDSSNVNQIKYVGTSIKVIRNHAFIEYESDFQKGKYSKVLILDLSNENIKIEPSAIAFKGLERLEITSGPVQLEINSFQNLSNLQHLKITVNEKSANIRQVLKNLPQLKSLELVDNHTIGICGSSNDPIQIEELQYSGGIIESISSKSFECLKNLAKLTIRETSLKLIEPGAFNFLKYLKKMSLTDNFYLTSIPSFNLEELEILDLSNNSILNVDNITFSMNANCQLLNLSHNYLDILETGSFKNLKCLIVDLGKNRLEHIENFEFNNSRIITLLLDDNSIRESVDETKWGIDNEKTKVYFHVNHIDYAISNIQSGRENITCYFSENFFFHICQNNTILLKVIERIMPYRLLTETLIFEDTDIILTKDNIFYNLTIKNFVIESSAKPFQLFAGSLKGLPNLENFQLDTQPILIKNTTFFYIKNTLKHLLLSVNESQSFLCNSLQGIKNLITLTIVNHDAFTFCNEICFEKGSYLKFKYLHYKRGSFETVQSNAFSCLKNLEYLSIDYTNITGFDSDAFNGLDNLVILSLQSNFQLTHINKNVFGQMENLKKLILSLNSIEFIEDGAFSKLNNNLSLLDLSRNKLHAISDKTFEGIISIEQIDLSNNEIINFVNDPNLMSLVYGYNRSQLFAENGSKIFKVELFCHIENWWTICINGTIATSITLNEIDSTLQITDEEKSNFQIEIPIDNITSIRNDAWKNIDSQLTIKSLILNKNIRDGLLLSSNSFDGLFKLENLELNVGPSILEHGAFYRFSKMNHLKIEVNETKQYLSKSLMNLRLLTSLNIVKNKTIDICGNEFSQKLPSILYLSYIEGLCTILHKNSFICLPSLEYLQVTKTNLTTIEPDAFFGLDLLEKINLSYNKIKCIAIHVFNHLQVLKILRLNNNEITGFDIGSLITVNNNYTLINVSYNKIVDIPDKTFGNLECKIFDIRSNPLHSTTKNIMGSPANIGELIVRKGHRIHYGDYLKNTDDEPQRQYTKWLSGSKDCHGRYNVLSSSSSSSVCRPPQASKIG